MFLLSHSEVFRAYAKKPLIIFGAILISYFKILYAWYYTPSSYNGILGWNIYFDYLLCFKYYAFLVFTNIYSRMWNLHQRDTNKLCSLFITLHLKFMHPIMIEVHLKHPFKTCVLCSLHIDLGINVKHLTHK